LVNVTSALAREYAASGLWSGDFVDSYLDATADRSPDSVAIVDRDRMLTHAELRATVAHATAGLRGAGVRRGDIVSWILPNWAEAAITHFAAVRLGAVSNPITPIYRHREIEFILRQARSRVVVVPAMYRNFDYAAMIEELAPRLPDLEHVVVIADSAEDVTGRHRAFEELLEFQPNDSGDGDGKRSADDPALLLFTSGTTSDPKGVIHSHNTLVYENKSIVNFYELTSSDVVFMPSPVAHITGLLYGLQLPPMLGSSVVLQDLWHPSDAVALLERHGATFTVGATPFLHGLVMKTDARSRSLKLRVFACGGADVPPELVRAATTELGCCVARVYGSTEYPTLTASSSFDDLDRRATTDGRLIGSAEMRIVDADGALVPVGTAGEILVRGPEMFLGYLDAAGISRAAFDGDGWFPTGDLGRVDDDGYLTIAGRKKDIIIRGGENLSVKEIEDLLFEHPQVVEVAVVGMPDPGLVERVCAFVVPAGDERLELDDLCRLLDTKHIAKQKYPERLELVDALPKTASGKIQKFRLREAIAAKLRAEAGVV
jgi:cyclohexanecarboxylate-CoA ligase